MGYSNIRNDKRHESDEARIKELEAQLKKEREARTVAAKESDSANAARQQPNQSQTVIVKNEGCLAGAGKGCLMVVFAILILAVIGKIVELLSR